MTTYSERQVAIAPTVLPEHLRGIREQVLKNHWFHTLDGNDDAECAEMAFVLLELSATEGVDQESIQKLAEYIKAKHNAYKQVTERYDSLIDGVISWAGWAANWTRRLQGNEVKSPPEEVKK